MAGDMMTLIARRLLAMATAVMPRSRRDWGRAMSAELACARSRGEQARLVLGAMRVALLPPHGVADYGRAATRSAVRAAIAYVPLGLGLYLANVVFPSPEDSAAGVLVTDAYLVFALMTVGALARRWSARPGAPVVAGMAAGLVLAVLSMATFAVIDNAFLSIVSHQQGKIDGFRESGMTSMRDYINRDLRATAPGMAIVLTLAGAAFAPIGAALAQEAAIAWSRLRHLPRR
jgi:hypothetical protein